MVCGSGSRRSGEDHLVEFSPPDTHKVESTSGFDPLDSFIRRKTEHLLKLLEQAHKVPVQSQIRDQDHELCQGAGYPAGAALWSIDLEFNDPIRVNFPRIPPRGGDIGSRRQRVA